MPVENNFFLSRFNTDKQIFVVGLGLYGTTQAEYDVTYQLQTATGNILGSNKSHILCDGTNCTFRVMFKNAIEIQPHINYTVSATLQVNFIYSLLFNCFVINLKSISSCLGTWFTLWHKRAAQGNCGLSWRRQSHLPVFVCCWPQQWNFSRRWSNTWNNILHLTIMLRPCGGYFV